MLPANPNTSKGVTLDTQTPDFLSIRGAGNFPAIKSLPREWVLLFLHAVYPELGMGSTLPQLWKGVMVEQVERVLVSSPTPLVIPADRETAYVCDAMPAEIADRFVS
jgi:hypothetical protein